MFIFIINGNNSYSGGNILSGTQKQYLITILNKQIDKEDKKVIELQCKKVFCIFGDNLNNKYLQSLLVNKDFTSLRSQKQIKLIIKPNCYYNIGFKFIKIYNKNNSKVNNIVLDPFN